MKRAGVREARQNLTRLLDEVRKGREVLITERGRPVARLVPVAPRRPFPDLSQARLRAPKIEPPLSEAILADREDRG